MYYALFIALVLDEDEIPELQNPPADAVDFADMIAFLFVAPFRSQIEMDLTARSARSDFAHLPKIIFFTVPGNVSGIYIGFIFPDIEGFIIVVINRGVESVLGEFPHIGNQFPAPFDGVKFVVIAEGPVAQHFEKSMVAVGNADFLEVIMFAGDADTFLGIYSPGIGWITHSQEDVLKLIHSGVDK